MKLPVVALLSLVAFAEAFTVTRLVASPSSSTLRATNNIDDSIARIQKEYNILKETLLKDHVLKKDPVETAEIAEEMIEKAADLAALHRYKQERIIDAAENERLHALDDARRAHLMEVEAHREAEFAELDSRLVEGFEDGDGYEDMERLREHASAHAAHNLEYDAHELEVESSFLELEAEAIEFQAKEILEKVKDYEESLHNSLKRLRQRKMEAIKEEWQQEADKHNAFISKVKELLHKRSQEG